MACLNIKLNHRLERKQQYYVREMNYCWFTSAQELETLNVGSIVWVKKCTSEYRVNVSVSHWNFIIIAANRL